MFFRFSDGSNFFRSWVGTGFADHGVGKRFLGLGVGTGLGLLSRSSNCSQGSKKTGAYLKDIFDAFVPIKSWDALVKTNAGASHFWLSMFQIDGCASHFWLFMFRIEGLSSGSESCFLGYSKIIENENKFKICQKQIVCGTIFNVLDHYFCSGNAPYAVRFYMYYYKVQICIALIIRVRLLRDSLMNSNCVNVD